MNLVTEPWIPVVTPDGKRKLVSLSQVFNEGRRFSDLAVRPHERIALMRLLICIAQAALDGPEDIDEWDDAPSKLPTHAEQYLERWLDSFNLFDRKHPFLQVADLEKPPKKGKSNDGESTGPNPVSKLDFSLASQNNSALFDHHATNQQPRLFPPAWIGISLLAFQNFSSSGRIGVATWKGIESQGGGSSLASPCIQKLMLHTFIRRENVLNTICANLLTKEQASKYLAPYKWGQPLWERFPKSPSDQDAIINATETYLGRLVPISRWIKIDSKGGEMILANGFGFSGHPDRPAESTATEFVIEVKNKSERKLLRVDERGIWRQLPAILVKYTNNKRGRSPLCLLNQPPDSHEYDIWVGGLSWSSEGGYIDAIEAVLKIVPRLQTESGVKNYEEEVLYADKLAKRLASAVCEYRKQIDGILAKVDQEANGRKRKELQEKLDAVALTTAIRHYWTSVEKNRPQLLAYIESLGTTFEKVEQSKKTWRRSLYVTALEAYKLACGQETPRQIRAFALGWDKLLSTSKSDETPSESTEQV